MITDALVICQDCDAVYRRQALPRRGRARCSRCEAELYRDSAADFDSTIAMALAALIALIVANVYPVIWINVQGSSNAATLWGAVLATDNYGLGLVSVLVAVMAFFAPLMQLVLTLYLAIPLRLGHRPAGFLLAMHALRHLQPWSMVEVFLLGSLVAVVKMAGLADVRPGVGLWAFGALTLLLTGLVLGDSEHFWRAAADCDDIHHDERVNAA